MNPISNASLIDNKIYQIQIAKSHGFDIPDFLYSNDRSKLIEFEKEKGPVALKFMAQEMYKLADGSFNGLYVNKLLDEDLLDFNRIDENPVFLQKYIDKSYEVRYTFVEGEHFVCKIDSQSNSRTSIDWRRYNIPETPHHVTQAPIAISRMVNSFMNDVGLAYGAFDFIVDNHGHWWYLEVNSAGQWLWIEDLVQLPIAAAIASVLIKHDEEEE